MMLRSCLTALLVVCGVVGLACTDAAVAAKPAPQKLWELYPLDPAGSRGRERQRTAMATAPATTTAAGTTTTPDARPAGGVAGVSTTQRPRTAAEGIDSGGGGTPIGIGLMFGVAAAAITLLALAALPSDRGPTRVAELVAARRLDMMVAGAFALLFVAVVYFVGVK
jgi:hypothetical protein